MEVTGNGTLGSSQLLSASLGSSRLLSATLGFSRLLPAPPGFSRLLPASPGSSWLLPAPLQPISSVSDLRRSIHRVLSRRARRNLTGSDWKRDSRLLSVPLCFSWLLSASLGSPRLLPASLRPISSVSELRRSVHRVLSRCARRNLTGSDWKWDSSIVQVLCESRGGRPGLSVLTSLMVSVDVKQY